MSNLQKRSLLCEKRFMLLSLGDQMCKTLC